jgi:transcriptional regulator with XRE-family HTH domain/quercetin dioxygenase-like cupin family protein
MSDPPAHAASPPGGGVEVEVEAFPCPPPDRIVLLTFMSHAEDNTAIDASHSKSERPKPNGRKLEIGARLAALRAQRGLKASTLARQIGLSPSLISQIERGQSRPSVSTLVALAEALDVKLDDFFGDPEEPERPPTPHAPSARAATVTPLPVPSAATTALRQSDHYVVRKADRWVIDIKGGVHWERLTPTSFGNLEFLELVYEPHAESDSQLYRHSGVEMVLVLSGQLHIYVAFARYELGPGDSICFPSRQPHRYVNPSDQTTRVASVRVADESCLDRS